MKLFPKMSDTTLMVSRRKWVNIGMNTKLNIEAKLENICTTKSFYVSGVQALTSCNQFLKKVGRKKLEELGWFMKSDQVHPSVVQTSL